ncbi:hypothetical protein ABTE19_20590, partial [Acinetobacter baumannii]
AKLLRPDVKSASCGCFCNLLHGKSVHRVDIVQVEHGHAFWYLNRIHCIRGKLHNSTDLRPQRRST